MVAVLYHNPRCSKSRAALALLEEQGVDFEVVRYLSRHQMRRDFASYCHAWHDASGTHARLGARVW